MRPIGYVCVVLNGLGIASNATAAALVVVSSRIQILKQLGYSFSPYPPLILASAASVLILFASRDLWKGRPRRAAAAGVAGGLASALFVAYVTLAIPVLAWATSLAFAIPLGPFVSAVLAIRFREEFRRPA